MMIASLLCATWRLLLKWVTLPGGIADVSNGTLVFAGVMVVVTAASAGNLYFMNLMVLRTSSSLIIPMYESMLLFDSILLATFYLQEMSHLRASTNAEFTGLGVSFGLIGGGVVASLVGMKSMGKKGSETP